MGEKKIYDGMQAQPFDFQMHMLQMPGVIGISNLDVESSFQGFNARVAFVLIDECESYLVGKSIPILEAVWVEAKNALYHTEGKIIEKAAEGGFPVILKDGVGYVFVPKNSIQTANDMYGIIDDSE